MKKIFLLLFFASITGLFAQEQDCTQDENVKRFMVRGKAALELAEKPEDYKLAVEQFQKALEYSPKCPEVHYNLGLCYEETGKLDPENYREAISYLNNYLLFNPDAENKDEVQEKIYKIEFLAEQAGGMSLKNLLGKWKFYWGDGETVDYERYDIKIFENNGIYYVGYNKHTFVAFDMDKQKRELILGGSLTEYGNTTELTYHDGIVSFKVTHIYSLDYKHRKYRNRLLPGTKEEKIWTYELYFENGILKGNVTGSFWYLAECYKLNQNWKTMEDCINAGGGSVLKDCSGDCTKDKVYFIKQ